MKMTECYRKKKHISVCMCHYFCYQYFNTNNNDKDDRIIILITMIKKYGCDTDDEKIKNKIQMITMATIIIHN